MGCGGDLLSLKYVTSASDFVSRMRFSSPIEYACHQSCLVCENNGKHMKIIENHVKNNERQRKSHENHYDNHIKLEGTHGVRRIFTIP